MGIRKEVKNIASAIQERARSDPEIFINVGQSFVGGLLQNRTSVSRIEEFCSGIKSVKSLLGYDGEAAQRQRPVAGLEYLKELRDGEVEINPASITGCVQIFLRDGVPFHYEIGRVAKGYAGIGRFLASEQYIMQLEQEHVADVFYSRMNKLCESRTHLEQERPVIK